MFKLLLKRPLTVIMIVLMILLMGLYMLFRIPVDLFPDLNVPVITITTINPGASPEEIEDQISKIIEKEMTDLEDIDTINSTSSQNVSRVMIQFDWGTDLNVVENEIRSKLNRIQGDLPLTIEAPVVEKINPSDTPIVELALVGTADLKELTTIAEEEVRGELQRVKGVASVKILGGQENEIQIALDEKKLIQYGLSISQVQESLQKDHVTLAIGSVNAGNKLLTVKSDSEIKNIDELANIPILTPKSIPLRLKDIAEVSIKVTDIERQTYFNNKNAVTINIYKQSDANTINVASKVQDEIRALAGQLGEGDLIVINDSSQFINNSVKNLTKEGLIGAGLATLIMYFFLGEVAATLVIALAIPISIIAAFILMYFSGLTINLITLGALTVSIGLVVDDAVVVLQNIYRHFKEEGKSILQAAIDGTKEVVAAVFSSTVVKMIVFLPMLFVGGMAGQIFRPLALTVIYALFASLLVSFTVTPTLTALLLSISKTIPSLQKKSKWSLLLDHGRLHLERKYKEILVYALKYRKIVLSIAFLSFVGGAAFIPIVGKEFMPKMDAGEFTIHINMAPNTKLENTEHLVTDLLKKVEQIESLESTYVGIGFTMRNPDQEQSDKAFINVKLKDKTKRDQSTAFVMESLRKNLKYPGVQIKIQEKGFIVASLFSSDPVLITIKGDNLEVLQRISHDITKMIQEVPGIRDTDNSFNARRGEYILRFDKESLKSYGLDVMQVSRMLRMAVEGDVVGIMRTDTGNIDIRLMYDIREDKQIENITQMQVPTKHGMIPLTTFIQEDKGSTPADIHRENQMRMSYVTADMYLADLATVNAEIEEKIANYKFPRGYSIELGGEAEDMKESFADLAIALLFAIILIYMVMVAEFENFKHPFIIMFTIPLTLLGITGSLIILNRSISVSAILGVIMLSGIIVGNGILMIEFMKQLREQGMDAYDAVLEAATIRLTPILMTTGTALLGMAPIALGMGEGSEMNAPMATVVLGGLSVGTLLTLFVIPLLYYSMEINKKKTKQWLFKEHIDG